MSLLEYIVASSLAEYGVHDQHVFLNIFGSFHFLVNYGSNIGKQRIFVSDSLISLVLFHELFEFIELYLVEFKRVDLRYNFESEGHIAIQNVGILLFLGI